MNDNQPADDVMGFPVISDVPEIDTRGMIEVDRLMIEEYNISLIQMMENAGRALALTARAAFLGGDASGKRIAVLAGSGGNGGGAITASRRLAAWGAEVHIGLSAPDRMTAVPERQLAIARGLAGINILADRPQDPTFDLILDGLIGYSLKGAPRGTVADWITWANDASTPVLALDVPSGFDAATGTALDPAIHAAATLTLALPKRGLQAEAMQSTVGALYCADISVPPELYRHLDPPIEVPDIFRRGDVVRVKTAPPRTGR
ncbi:NAD(P)H-hydrate epimerase [Bauldia sp.]|uniref:NAD(P)H-hydrate epimerase n=1 Tax=Bauldia sp. TaxID=2575872 RepID=UPI003BA8880E